MSLEPSQTRIYNVIKQGYFESRKNLPATKIGGSSMAVTADWISTWLWAMAYWTDIHHKKAEKSIIEAAAQNAGRKGCVHATHTKQLSGTTTQGVYAW